MNHSDERGSMGRVFVLGAGFSKAAADLPLMKEIVPRIREMISKDIRDENSGVQERAHAVGDFLRRARDRYLIQPLRQRDIEVAWDDFFEDFEFLLTILDLNSTWDHNAQGINGHGYSLARMDAAPDNLARQWIDDYIHRALWRNEEAEDNLHRFVSKLRPDDTVITFNYDLLIDRALWRSERWHPSSGYGVSFQPTPHWKAGPRASQVLLLKLHGSLNWDVGGGSLMLHPMYNESIEYFPDCVVTPDPFQIRKPPFGGYGILPSLSKCFSSRALLDIWAQAHECLRRAKEVIVIGYSLPEADGATWTLFGTSAVGQRKQSVFTGADVETVADRFRIATGFEVVVGKGGFEGFLNS